MTVGELLNYINENIKDGTLNESDPVRINDAGVAFNIYGLFNDAHELLISETSYR